MTRLAVNDFPIAASGALGGLYAALVEAGHTLHLDYIEVASEPYGGRIG